MTQEVSNHPSQSVALLLINCRCNDSDLNLNFLCVVFTINKKRLRFPAGLHRVVPFNNLERYQRFDIKTVEM